MTDEPTAKACTMADLELQAAEQKAEMDKLFEHDEKLGYLTLRIDYEYHIELSRIPDQEALLAWTRHLLSKRWFERHHAKEFIDRVMAIKGWTLKHL